MRLRVCWPSEPCLMTALKAAPAARAPTATAAQPARRGASARSIWERPACRRLKTRVNWSCAWIGMLTVVPAIRVVSGRLGEERELPVKLFFERLRREEPYGSAHGGIEKHRRHADGEKLRDRQV